MKDSDSETEKGVELGHEKTSQKLTSPRMNLGSVSQLIVEQVTLRLVPTNRGQPLFTIYAYAFFIPIVCLNNG